jgi:hypothetical protein
VHVAPVSRVSLLFAGGAVGASSSSCGEAGGFVSFFLSFGGVVEVLLVLLELVSG